MIDVGQNGDCSSAWCGLVSRRWSDAWLSQKSNKLCALRNPGRAERVGTMAPRRDGFVAAAKIRIVAIKLRVLASAFLQTSSGYRVLPNDWV